MNEHIEEKQFCLIDEPWIAVKNCDGSVEEVSLLDAFRRAHTIQELSGELPTQDVALLRLFLAVVYDVFTQVTVRGEHQPLVTGQSRESEVLKRWTDIWENGSFPAELIENYLRHYQERFYLFHPTTPFFQVADLHTADGKAKPISRAIGDVPSRDVRRFFINRAGKGLEAIGFAEAARWLVHLQAWDYAGKKASVLGGTLDGGGTGWLGKLGVVYAKRATLFETLLLNYVLIVEGKLIDFGSPCWTQNAKTAAKKIIRPSGYVDLLTWQSRRVKYFIVDGKVAGILSSYGDVFEKNDTFIEQMSGWHESSEKSQAGKYIPNLHHVDRSAWRDLGALLQQAGSTETKRGNRTPGIVDWLAYLERKRVVELARLNLAIVGIEYGTAQSIVDEIIVDTVSLNAHLLAELDEEWIAFVIQMVKLTDNSVYELGSLAVNISEAEGNDSDVDKKGVRSTTQEEAYFILDNSFRNWLVSVDPAADNLQEKRDEWLLQLKQMLVHKADELLSEASDAALIGRDKDRNAFQAYARFRYKLGRLTRASQELEDNKEKGEDT